MCFRQNTFRCWGDYIVSSGPKHFALETHNFTTDYAIFSVSFSISERENATSRWFERPEICQSFRGRAPQDPGVSARATSLFGACYPW